MKGERGLEDKDSLFRRLLISDWNGEYIESDGEGGELAREGDAKGLQLLVCCRRIQEQTIPHAACIFYLILFLPFHCRGKVKRDCYPIMLKNPVILLGIGALVGSVVTKVLERLRTRDDKEEKSFNGDGEDSNEFVPSSVLQFALVVGKLKVLSLFRMTSK